MTISPDLLKFSRMHLGCGTIIADDFINVDCAFSELKEALDEGCLYSIDGKPNTFILKHDLKNGIPSEPKSLDVIYHSHFLEHLSREESLIFLKNCEQNLKPGGHMRVVVPDLELWCQNYIGRKLEFFDWYKSAYLGKDNPMYKTTASIFTGMLYNWGHKMAYDFEALESLLKDCGFTNIRKSTWGHSSKIPDIDKIENSNPREFESLLVECESKLT
jgi:predicted SAM-dependent methyltransferase